MLENKTTYKVVTSIGWNEVIDTYTSDVEALANNYYMKQIEKAKSGDPLYKNGVNIRFTCDADTFYAVYEQPAPKS